MWFDLKCRTKGFLPPGATIGVVIYIFYNISFFFQNTRHLNDVASAVMHSPRYYFAYSWVSLVKLKSRMMFVNAGHEVSIIFVQNMAENYHKKDEKPRVCEIKRSQWSKSGQNWSKI